MKRATHLFSTLRNLSIRAKLSLLTGISAASLVFLCCLFQAIISQVKVTGPVYKAIVREMDLRADILPPPEFIIETHLTVLEIARALKSDPNEIDGLLKKLNSLKSGYDDRQAYWAANLPKKTDLEGSIRDGILRASKEPAARYFETVYGQLIPAVKAGDSKAVDVLVDISLNPLYIQHKAAIEKLADLTEKSQALRENEAKQTIARSGTVAVAFCVVLVVLSVAFGWYALLTITRPLGKAVQALKTAASRNLTARLEVHSSDEIGVMAAALNDALSAIREGFGEAAKTAEVVSKASAEVESAARQLSSGTESQAASIVETSASMEEVTATVKLNADHASQAHSMAREVSESAVKGSKVVDAAMQAMEEISEASIRITEIIASIEEIAFQTNILAMNASIEASIAGEHGRGFAVVAEEVRALASRSSTASGEIRRLIKNTGQKVEQGRELVRRSAETLHHLAGSVTEVSTVLAGISNACSEQALGLEQVNTAVAQVDSVTQSNASRSNQLFLTAKRLSLRSGELQTMVGTFEIGVSLTG